MQAKPEHWSERGRATSVADSDAQAARVAHFVRSAEERRHDDTRCIRNGLVVAGGV